MNELIDAGFYAERLESLFEQIRRPNGRRFSYRQAARGIKELHQQNPRYKLVTASYISKIVSGNVKSPSFSALESLAKFFGVEVAYFSQLQENDQQKAILRRQLSQEKIFDIADQANRLTVAERQMVLDMMKSIQQVRESNSKEDGGDAN